MWYLSPQRRFQSQHPAAVAPPFQLTMCYLALEERGSSPTIRHNEVRDTFALWMSEICSAEPHLQNLTSKSLGGATAIRGDEARVVNASAHILISG